jgi:hypothetical protein
VWLPLAHTEGHIVVAGTAGAGKTRLFDPLVTQAVLRGEAVVIIDPKGDQDLRRAAGWVRYYREAVRERHPSTVVDGLASLFEHEQVHFAKMIASLMPILNMPTAADLGPLLSPDAADTSDRSRLTSMAECIDRAQVVYLGLDALSDAMVGSAFRQRCSASCPTCTTSRAWPTGGW